MMTEIDIPTGKILSSPVSSLSRGEKGFRYEYENCRILDAHGITYESNPQSYLEWVTTTMTDFDIKVRTTKKGWIRVECKFTLTHIHHCWFMRDWYPRNCDIIVTNDKWNVRYEDRKLLRETGRKLMNTYEFLNYILKLCKDGNQYRVLEHYGTNIMEHELEYRTALTSIPFVLTLIFNALKTSGIEFLSHLILIPWTLVDCLSKCCQCQNREGTNECNHCKVVFCTRCDELHSRLLDKRKGTSIYNTPLEKIFSGTCTAMFRRCFTIWSKERANQLNTIDQLWKTNVSLG